MKLYIKYLPVAMLFLACDNPVVTRTEYDALLSEKQQLEALNDSLQFELSGLKMYADHLEEQLDSIQNN